ncbi:MAG: right-handed parallel beta-helix repeat-containing protein [Clostridia bacterium]|nr:right-handed parallel beta-helix repeat-containing protein [Clostridia bacterium]
MNELSKLFLKVNDGDNITLENKTYHVRQDDSFELTGYFCSNTAKKHENPDGLRRTAIYLKDKSNITINGNGATVLVHGKMTPILFDRCSNITVKNLTVDYACPTMAEFTVISNDNGAYVIKINPECLFRVEGNDLIWQGETGSDGNPYWEDSYIGNRRLIKVFDPKTETCSDFRREDLPFEKIEQLDETTLRVYLKNKSVDFKEGCTFQTRNIVRDQTGSLFQRCKNLHFENLRIKFMHGLGMVSQFCENVTYKNCDFTPAEGRTIASTADFFQFSGCKGNLTIESCNARGAQDDYVNVHGTHLRIVEKDDAENSIVVRFMHNESWGFQAFEKGDELEFIRWDTLIPYSSTKVTDFKKLNDTDIRLWLDRPLPDIIIDKDVVENASWTPNLYVKNCDFGPTAGRGILCTTRGEVIIENNTFRNLWGPALLIEDDCNFWFESGYTNEIVFRNNRVIGCDYGATWETSSVIRYTPKVMNEKSKAYVHGKLTLTGNTFENSYDGTHSIWLEYLKDAEITDNVFDAPYAIHTRCVGNVTDKNNK